MLYVHTSILTDSPCTVLRGAPSEASGQALSGRVMLQLCRSLKVTQVIVAFQSSCMHRGSLWSNQSALYDNTKLEQVLFSATGTPLGYAVWGGSAEASIREMPFSFAIPGTLHESVCTAFGSIGYEIKVTIRSCGFGINTWVQSLRIPVLRVPEENILTALSLSEALRAQADWLGAVELQMLGDSAAVPDEYKLCVRSIIRPLQKGQTLVDVGLRLIENTRFKSVVSRFGDSPKSSNVLCQSQIKPRDDSWHALPLQHEHCFDLELDIPAAFRGIQYDMDTARVHISHELVLTATVVDSKQVAHYLRLAVPIQVVPKIALETSFAELPTYGKSSSDRLLLDSSYAAVWAEGENEGGQHRAFLPPPSYQAIVNSHNSLTV
ncbi:hypothetical protein IWW37_001689 [Coemansia sp. RSA 2050]|nr:hypothetical protein IWW37_001689 [Coemansia sp. RSA 2050]KAJ2735401.1 hypothetical protein IW152_001627 [Coemansia sp. BCRC 34962]